MTREQTLREAAKSVSLGPSNPAEQAHETKLATAGADAERARIFDHARHKASIHHRLAAESRDDDELRERHVALSSAYLTIAAEIDLGEHWEGGK